MDEHATQKHAAALRRKEAELTASLTNREGLAAEPQADLYDEIQSAADRALVIQTLDRASTLLREVRAALDRLAHGSYGCCVQCGEEINPKRLTALPWAALCLNCQEVADGAENPQAQPARFSKAA